MVYSEHKSIFIGQQWMHSMNRGIIDTSDSCFCVSNVTGDETINKLHIFNHNVVVDDAWFISAWFCCGYCVHIV